MSNKEKFVLNQEAGISSNPEKFAESIIAKLEKTKGAEQSVELANFVEVLDNASLSNPGAVIKVLDYLYKNKDGTLVQFYEEPISGKKHDAKLFRPDGVLGVVPLTRNLTGAVTDQAQDGNKDILDVGCGCGLTSIAAADLGNRVIALDLSRLAVATTRLNAIWNNAEANIKFVHSNLSDYQSDQKFDILASNPPISPLPEDKANEAVTLYRNLSEGKLDTAASQFAINYYVDEEGRNLLDLIFQKALLLLKENGEVIVSGGNICQNTLETFQKIGGKYGFKSTSIKSIGNSYADFRKGYTLEPLFGEDFIKKAVTDGIEVYTDQALKNRVANSKEIEGINYFFKGFAAIFKK